MMAAYRVREGGRVLYLMPYRERGQRVLFEQHAETFETTRRTVGDEEAREVAENGRQVSLMHTPAWCDPAAPRPEASPSAPTQP
jgi:hypothetical protein